MSSAMTIEKVQQWVVSALLCAVSSFPIGALVVTSQVKDRDGQPGVAIALCVMAALIGLLAVGAGRLVHRLSPLSAWVLVGTVPGLAALAWLLTR